MTPLHKKTRSLLLGIAIGDAMGVPYEFLEADQIDSEGLTNMKAFGTYNQPAGTFSDDSSMTFCTVEALTDGLNLFKTAENFLKWKNKSFWTATDEVFDIGITTRRALEAIENGIPILSAGPTDERSCGNGSLMRILPLIFHLKDLKLNERYNWVVKFSSITHGHIRTHMACFILIEYAICLLNSNSKPKNELMKYEYFVQSISETKKFFHSDSKFKDELVHFDTILEKNNRDLSVGDLYNTGYVVHSLEVVLNRFLNNNSYESDVVSTIKLGGDTDTNACIIGGLSALYYGEKAIPSHWLDKLKKRTEIEDLAERWANSL